MAKYKLVKIFSCDTCPYNSGWDFDKCENYFEETCFCAHERITKGVGKDIPLGCMDRTKMSGKVPFPKWCPLQEKE